MVLCLLSLQAIDGSLWAVLGSLNDAVLSLLLNNAVHIQTVMYLLSKILNSQSICDICFRGGAILL